MSRRPTPWQRGHRARTSRGLISKLVQASLVMSALSLLFGTAASPSVLDDTPPSVTYTVDGITGTNGWYRGSNGGNSPSSAYNFPINPSAPLARASW